MTEIFARREANSTVLYLARVSETLALRYFRPVRRLSENSGVHAIPESGVCAAESEGGKRVSSPVPLPLSLFYLGVERYLASEAVYSVARAHCHAPAASATARAVRAPERMRYRVGRRPMNRPRASPHTAPQARLGFATTTTKKRILLPDDPLASLCLGTRRPRAKRLLQSLTVSRMCRLVDLHEWLLCDRFDPLL